MFQTVRDRMATSKSSKKKLRLIPLGGLGEIGKNMLVVEYGKEMLVIDAGLMFPQEEMLGIDLVLPNFSYLKKNKSRLRAIILTTDTKNTPGAFLYFFKKKKFP